MEICQKILTTHAPPFNITQGHWNLRHRSMATYDFLLVFHMTVGPSRTVFEINSNNCYIFPAPVHLAPPLRGFPFEFCNGGRTAQTRMMPLPECQKYEICPFV